MPEPTSQIHKITDSRLWFYLAILLAGGWLLTLLAPVLTPFVGAMLLAWLGDPLCQRLEAKGLSRNQAVALVFFGFLLLFLLALLVLIPQLEAQISYLVSHFPTYLAWLKAKVLPWLEGYLGYSLGQSTDIQFLGVLQKLLGEHWREAGGLLKLMLGSIAHSGSALLGLLVNLLLIPVLGFYLLRDWRELTQGLYSLLPRRFAPIIGQLSGESDAMLSAFIKGQLMVMLSLGIIYSLGLWMLGIKVALLIGLIAGLVSFVPYLRLILGVLMAGVAAVLQFQSVTPLLGVAIVFLIGQVAESIYLTPKWVGEQIGMHPVAVIFAIMAGGQLFGFFGVLVALPVAAVAMVWLKHMVARYRASSLY